MKKKSENNKLVTGKKLILIITAAIGGIGWYAYKNYTQKGYFDSANIFAILGSIIIVSIIISVIVWWANRE